jgi:hypothetical protein
MRSRLNGGRAPYPAETFEPVAIAGAHEDAGMHVEAARLCGPGALHSPTGGAFIEGHGRAVAGEAQESAAEEPQLHASFERREFGGLVRALLEGRSSSRPRRRSHGVMRLCGGPVGAGCARGGCFPEPSGELGEVCVHQPGDLECPPAYPVKRLLFAGFDDSRACMQCTCVAPRRMHTAAM